MHLGRMSELSTERRCRTVEMGNGSIAVERTFHNEKMSHRLTEGSHQMDAIPRAASLMVTSDHIETWAFGLATALPVAVPSRKSLFSFDADRLCGDFIPCNGTYWAHLNLGDW